jgi:hypothetical protein
MKNLVRYMAYNQEFAELFEGDLDVKKVNTKIKSFCPTGFVLSITECPKEDEGNYHEFQKRADEEVRKLQENIDKFK